MACTVSALLRFFLCCDYAEWPSDTKPEPANAALAGRRRDVAERFRSGSSGEIGGQLSPPTAVN